MRRVGGGAAIALGISYALFGVVFFLLPEDQQAAEPATLLASLAEEGAVGYLAGQWLQALWGVLGLAVVGAVARTFSARREGLVHWASALGYLAFAVTIVESLAMIAAVYSGTAAEYAAADETTRAIIAGDLSVTSIAPQEWATFGLGALWLGAVNVLAILDRTTLRRPAVVGLLVAVGSALVPIGYSTGTTAIIVVAVVMGIVVAPVFYVWLGLRLRRPVADEPAPA